MIILFVIAGRIELKEETVENLLSTACLLQLSEVVEACCGFLMKQLHPSNCIGIRQFADAQGCSDLYKVANNYVMVSDVIHVMSKHVDIPCLLHFLVAISSRVVRYSGKVLTRSAPSPRFKP